MKDVTLSSSMKQDVSIKPCVFVTHGKTPNPIKMEIKYVAGWNMPLEWSLTMCQTIHQQIFHQLSLFMSPVQQVMYHVYQIHIYSMVLFRLLSMFGGCRQY